MDPFQPNRDVVNPAALSTNDLEPVLKIEDTAFGFQYVALRKTDKQGVKNARVVPFIVPYQTPAELFNRAASTARAKSATRRRSASTSSTDAVAHSSLESDLVM
jgi:hypothetical protein